MIEANEDKAWELAENYKEFKDVTTLNCSVNPNNINHIIEQYCGNNIDFLSIDIDGNDLFILESLNVLPRVLCIECNPTFPKRIKFSQNLDQNPPIGMSALYCYEKAIEKGLFPLCFLQGNMLAVRSDVGEQFFTHQPSFDEIYNDYERPVVFSDMKGTMYISRFGGYNVSRKANPFLVDKNSGTVYCLVKVIDKNFVPDLENSLIGEWSEVLNENDIFLKECFENSNERQKNLGNK
jgi:hypothetical protein